MIPLKYTKKMQKRLQIYQAAGKDERPHVNG